jgi:hypothetical protein
VFRFNAADITQAYATMSFSGKTLGANSNAFSMMTTDGTYFYFSYDAGNSGNDNVIAKYSLSGSTFTYVSTTTMGSAGNMMRFFVIDGFYYGFAFAGGDNKMRKFNSGGTLVYTSEDFSSAGSIALLIGKSLFLSTSSGRNFCRIWY